jgi:hypothetical protein
LLHLCNTSGSTVDCGRSRPVGRQVRRWLRIVLLRRRSAEFKELKIAGWLMPMEETYK